MAPLLCLNACKIACEAENNEKTETTAKSSVELMRLRADNLEGVVDRRRITFDERLSVDGGGSLRIEARGAQEDQEEEITVFKVSGIHAQGEQLVFRASLRGLKGQSAKLRVRVTTVPEDHRGKADEKTFVADSAESLRWTTPSWKVAQSMFILHPKELLRGITIQVLPAQAIPLWIDDVHIARRPFPLSRQSPGFNRSKR